MSFTHGYHNYNFHQQYPKTNIQSITTQTYSYSPVVTNFKNYKDVLKKITKKILLIK